MKEVPMVPSTSEQPQAISQSPTVTLQIPSVVKPILSNPTSGSISVMSDPDLQEMQKRVRALKTGQPAINVSESGAQGKVQFSTIGKYYTPASATLPYPGLDGHPRRIIPVTVSSSACTNEPSGEDLCTGCVAVNEKVLKSEDEIPTG